MNLPVDLQADALIAEIGRQVAAQRQALLDGAAREAEEIRQRARAKARARLRRAVEALRTAEQQRTQQVLAEIETAARHQAQVRAQQALALAWPRLATAIESRWHDPAARDCWIATQLAIAAARLPARAWTVRHPAAWHEADAAALHHALQRQGVAGATLQADAALHAGIVIEVGGARLDSTPQALLTDRPQVEAALLAMFEPAAASEAPR